MFRRNFAVGLVVVSLSSISIAREEMLQPYVGASVAYGRYTLNQDYYLPDLADKHEHGMGLGWRVGLRLIEYIRLEFALTNFSYNTPDIFPLTKADDKYLVDHYESKLGVNWKVSRDVSIFPYINYVEAKFESKEGDNYIRTGPANTTIRKESDKDVGWGAMFDYGIDRNWEISSGFRSNHFDFGKTIELSIGANYVF